MDWCIRVMVPPLTMVLSPGSMRLALVSVILILTTIPIQAIPGLVSVTLTVPPPLMIIPLLPVLFAHIPVFPLVLLTLTPRFALVAGAMRRAMIPMLPVVKMAVTIQIVSAINVLWTGV